MNDNALHHSSFVIPRLRFPASRASRIAMNASSRFAPRGRTARIFPTPRGGRLSPGRGATPSASGRASSLRRARDHTAGAVPRSRRNEGARAARAARGEKRRPRTGTSGRCLSPGDPRSRREHHASRPRPPALFAGAAASPPRSASSCPTRNGRRPRAKSDGKRRPAHAKPQSRKERNGFDFLKQASPFLATLRLCVKPVVVAVPLS